MKTSGTPALFQTASTLEGADGDDRRHPADHILVYLGPNPVSRCIPASGFVQGDRRGIFDLLHRKIRTDIIDIYFLDKILVKAVIRP